MGDKISAVACRLPSDVANYVLNKKRREILQFEQRREISIRIEADPSLVAGDNRITAE